MESGAINSEQSTLKYSLTNHFSSSVLLSLKDKYSPRKENNVQESCCEGCVVGETGAGKIDSEVCDSKKTNSEKTDNDDKTNNGEGRAEENEYRERSHGENKADTEGSMMISVSEDFKFFEENVSKYNSNLAVHDNETELMRNLVDKKSSIYKKYQLSIHYTESVPLDRQTYNSLLKDVEDRKSSEAESSHEELSESDVEAENNLTQFTGKLGSSDVEELSEEERKLLQDVVYMGKRKDIQDPKYPAYNNVCPQCKKPFSNLKCLKMHIRRMHLNERCFRCTQCPMSFTFQFDLDKHTKYVHGGKQYKCDRCEFSSNYSRNLEIHYNSVHLEKRVACLLCESTFPEEHKLLRHIKSAHNKDKPFECSMCDSKFSQRNDLERHMTYVHCGVRPFSCNLCGLMFARKGDLTRHQKVHENKLRARANNFVVLDAADSKPYDCPECDSIFRQKQTLQNHIKTVHSVEKPHICMECRRSFTSKLYLERHVDVMHKGLKPFACTDCNKSFSRDIYLKQHVDFVHNGLKPYACTECRRKFSVKHSLTRHIKDVHSQSMAVS